MKASADDKIVEAQDQQKKSIQSTQYYSPARDKMYFCSHQPITTEKLQEILERGFTNEGKTISL